MLEAFKGAATAGKGGDAFIAAIEAAKNHLMPRQEIEALAPQSPLEAMPTAAASRAPQPPFSAPRPMRLGDVRVEAARETLECIEASAGASRPGARRRRRC